MAASHRGCTPDQDLSATGQVLIDVLIDVPIRCDGGGVGADGVRTGDEVTAAVTKRAD